MDFQPNGTRIRNHRQVGSDDGIHTGFPGGVAQGMHRLQLFIVHNDIQCQISFGARLMAALDDFRQIFFRKIDCGAGTHVQLSYAEVHGVRSALQGGRQRFKRPRRGHDFYPVLKRHGSKSSGFFHQNDGNSSLGKAFNNGHVNIAQAVRGITIRADSGVHAGSPEPG